MYDSNIVMKFPIFQVDSFTETLFSGNPAAVVIPDRFISDDLMQQIAAENNLSETAFVFYENGKHSIRWFTPTLEVNLCGHATLAAAHILFTKMQVPETKLILDSKSGSIEVFRNGDSIFMNLPADNPRKIEHVPGLIEGLNADPVEIYAGNEDILAVFEREDAISSIAPDFSLLNKIDAMGVIITAPGEKYDFVSRVFAPRSGIPEDPVTGSAHTLLVPYWAERLGKKNFKAKQVSKRGGTL